MNETYIDLQELRSRITALEERQRNREVDCIRHRIESLEIKAMAKRRLQRNAKEQ
jgi:hypothetical protein